MLHSHTGKWAYYTFVGKFSSLSGIYQCIKIESFEDALTEKTDFGQSLYVPAGLTSDDYQQEYANYKGQDVFFLQTPPANPDTPTAVTTIPTPSNLIVGIPDFSVAKYNSTSIHIDLGFWSNADQYKVQGILFNVQQQILSLTNDPRAMHVYTGSPEWMKESEYAAMCTKREIGLPAVQSYPSQLQSLQAQNSALETELAYYKKLVIKQATTNKP